jgi:large subunit ribosomal protein L18
VSLHKKNKQRLERRIHRVRNKQLSRCKKFRISVFRSLNHIYAQVIDDVTSTTLLSFSSLNLNKNEKSGDKKTIAKIVGTRLGKLALEKSISDVFFDRGHFMYHGRVKALADGLREAGLKF